MAAKTLNEYMNGVKADFFYIKSISKISEYSGYELLDTISIEPYIKLLKARSQLVELPDSDVQKYKFKPRLLSNLIYGTENLYYIILMLNDMTVETFIPKKIYLLSSSNRSLIETIINKERSRGNI